MDKGNLRKQLRVFRTYHGVTQEEVGKVLGITKTSYCLKENGTYKITLDDMLKLAEKYNSTFTINANGIIIIP
jgi:DNA-binding XRE family transcriptional regulator